MSVTTLLGLSCDKARETFRQETVEKIGEKRQNNEDAVCYNMAYEVSKSAYIRGLTSVRFESGVLNTEYVSLHVAVWCTSTDQRNSYDCFYMWAPDSHFWSRGDGGFINPSHCFQAFDDSGRRRRRGSATMKKVSTAKGVGGELGDVNVRRAVDDVHAVVVVVVDEEPTVVVPPGSF